MPKETLNTRVTRLEEAMIRAFDGIERLDNALVTLADAQIKLHQEVAETGRKTDERIQALVSAIGELVRRLDGGTR